MARDGPGTECDKKLWSRKKERPDVRDAFAQKRQVQHWGHMVAETIPYP